MLGAEHPNALTARANLAASYYQAGHTAEAITIQVQVAAECGRTLGPDHPNTLTASKTLTQWWAKAASPAGVGKSAIDVRGVNGVQIGDGNTQYNTFG